MHTKYNITQLEFKTKMYMTEYRITEDDVPE